MYFIFPPFLLLVNFKQKMDLSEKDNVWYNYNAEDELVSNGNSGEQEKSLIGEILKQLKPGTEIYSLSMPAYLMSKNLFFKIKSQKDLYHY